MEITAKTPWRKNLGDVPSHLEYFQGSMFEAVEKIADEYPNNIAFDFMGRSTTYREMVTNIEKCARSLRTIGVREGDKVTIAMPNCPQAIYMFYAVNLAGAVANMVHPLSSEKELEFYINESESVTVVTLDQFYHKIEAIRQNPSMTEEEKQAAIAEIESDPEYVRIQAELAALDLRMAALGVKWDEAVQRAKEWQKQLEELGIAIRSEE